MLIIDEKNIFIGDGLLRGLFYLFIKLCIFILFFGVFKMYFKNRLWYYIFLGVFFWLNVMIFFIGVGVGILFGGFVFFIVFGRLVVFLIKCKNIK